MKHSLLISIILLYSSFIYSQKKPLDHTVYDSWQHIGERQISTDGKWVLYTIDPQEGDNELVIQSADTTYKFSVPRGYSAQLTKDNLFAIFKIKPHYKDTRDTKIKKKKPEDFPKDSIGILRLGTTQLWKRAAVKSFKSPAEQAGWVAYQLEKPQVKRPATGSKSVTDSLNRVIDSLKVVIETMPKKKKKNRDEEDESMDDFAEGDETPTASDTGSDLVLRNLMTGEEKLFRNVLEYYFSKTGSRLLIEQAKDPADANSKAAVILFNLTNSQSTILSQGIADYKNFAFSGDGSQVAYLANKVADPGALKPAEKFYRLYHYQDGKDSATVIADRYSTGMPLGNTVSEYDSISFSNSGRRLFFGIAPLPLIKDSSIIEIDMPKVDIWHYNDDYLQTVQNTPSRLRAEQQRSFLAMYEKGDLMIRQLGCKEVPQVMKTNEGDGDIFIGITDVGKRVEGQWRGNTLKDVYAIDVQTGGQSLVKENLYGQVYPSSTGRYILWYDREAKSYFSWDGKQAINISAKIKEPVWNEEFDEPDLPGNYGLMGWHKGDSAVYVYSRYDIWKLDPANESGQVNITGIGKAGKSRIRYLRLDPEKNYFTTGENIFYHVVDEKDKSEEIYEASVKDYMSFERVTGGHFKYDAVIKAKNNNTLLYTRESFSNPPDLYVHSLKPSQPEDGLRLSSINRQQSTYVWGTAELFRWKAYNGKDATGIVYKPENFDPAKKYPMIVYFYEKLSQELHDYKEPAPIRSAINIPFFVSRGYIIFLPDIEYKIGYPGQSAYDYIVSGSRALVKKGWVDSTKMALQGHSWGGYQAAQLATMTKLFKAVWAGAPVANMTSAYGGIRWQTGVSRQFQYEKTQSRIGGTLWEKLPLYLENSPLFHLDKVTAPMVIMHNDADGAVPWYQGIELFTGLRRLGKKVWLFNYNGQGHGLTQRQDMRDYQVRMQQFFDWILKGEKPARWITNGVPAVNKGKDWGLETDQ